LEEEVSDDDEEDVRLPEWVKAGASYRMHDRLFHIRAIVDDEHVVVREWWRSKNRWNYSVEHSVLFTTPALKGYIERKT
jgi:hypothetical protein